MGITINKGAELPDRKLLTSSSSSSSSGESGGIKLNRSTFCAKSKCFLRTSILSLSLFVLGFFFALFALRRRQRVVSRSTRTNLCKRLWLPPPPPPLALALRKKRAGKCAKSRRSWNGRYVLVVCDVGVWRSGPVALV